MILIWIRILEKWNELTQILAGLGLNAPDIFISPEQIPKQIKGIYFLWNLSDSCQLEYIGKSINVRKRLGNHHVLKNGHLIGIVQAPKKRLVPLEETLIGFLQPTLNYKAK